MNKFNFKKIFSIFSLIFVLLGTTVFATACSNKGSEQKNSSETKETYTVSQEEKDYLQKRFSELSSVNKDTIGYVYAPGTKLDEPIVQTDNNETYLTKTFEGAEVDFLGTVFMDADNKKDFGDRLTWLFGHARGSKVSDNRMFNDVNFYDNQKFFNEHPYVVIETPERKYYYEAAFLVIVPETTAFYRIDFENDKDFVDQLTTLKSDAKVKNESLTIDAKDKYLVLSTCREEDTTIRSNLYLRQIPDNELKAFLEKHKDHLAYKATR